MASVADQVSVEPWPRTMADALAEKLIVGGRGVYVTVRVAELFTEVSPAADGQDRL